MAIFNQYGFVVPNAYSEALGALPAGRSRLAVNKAAKASNLYAGSRSAGKGVTWGAPAAPRFRVNTSNLIIAAMKRKGINLKKVHNPSAGPAILTNLSKGAQQPAGEPTFATGGGGAGSYSGDAGGYDTGESGGEVALQQSSALKTTGDAAPAGGGFFSNMSTQKKVFIGLGVAGVIFLAWKKLGKGGRGAGSRKS